MYRLTDARNCNTKQDSEVSEGIHDGNFSLAASNQEPALSSSICDMIGSYFVMRYVRHMGAGTPSEE